MIVAYGTVHEVAAMNRLFEDPLLGSKNRNGMFWDGGNLKAMELLECASPWSSGEKHLAYLAVELWGCGFPKGHKGFKLLDAMSCLETKHQRTILEAIAIRAGLSITFPAPSRASSLLDSQ